MQKLPLTPKQTQYIAKSSAVCLCPVFVAIWPGHSSIGVQWKFLGCFVVVQPPNITKKASLFLYGLSFFSFCELCAVVYWPNVQRTSPRGRQTERQEIVQGKALSSLREQQIESHHLFFGVWTPLTKTNYSQSSPPRLRDRRREGKSDWAICGRLCVCVCVCVGPLFWR